MLHALTQAAHVSGPAEGDVRVIAITTSSAATKLTGSSSEFGSEGKWTGCFLSFIADVNLYYLFGDDGVTVDETAITGDTRCALLPAYTEKDLKLPTGEADPLYIALKGTGTGKLRIWLSSPK